MKKLSAEEAADIIPVKKGKFTWLFKELAKLKMGEGIIIEKKDWKTKKPPYKTIATASKNLNMTFDYGQMPDGNGWIVKRTK